MEITPNPQVAEVIQSPYVIWDYSERITIDRKRANIEVYKKLAEDCVITTKYHIGGGVACFLDEYDFFSLFADAEGAENNSEADDLMTRKFTITVEAKNEEPHKLQGNFNGDELPSDYAGFIESLGSFLSHYNYQGELFEERTYRHKRRRQGELIYCSVALNSRDQTYYYLTDNEDLRIDDIVLVPFGRKNAEKLGVITDIEYFTEDAVPFPLENTKRIICRISENGEREDD